jgi:hypothetical protein
MEKTIVVFRKFKEGKDIVALFPKEIVDHNGHCSSYQHIGQHGPASYSSCILATTPAKPHEYYHLKQELERIGYVLEVKQRFNKRK